MEKCTFPSLLFSINTTMKFHKFFSIKTTNTSIVVNEKEHLNLQLNWIFHVLDMFSFWDFFSLRQMEIIRDFGEPKSEHVFKSNGRFRKPLTKSQRILEMKSNEFEWQHENALNTNVPNKTAIWFNWIERSMMFPATDHSIRNGRLNDVLKEFN